ncbi:MAG TPA: TonB-dependent receptor [Sphingomicrobium sp.]|nr:TonB-dependent receptor [Sphingomicrobium sp.]
MSNRFYRASLLATTVIAGMAYASPAFAQDAPPAENTSTDDQAPGVTTQEAVTQEAAAEGEDIVVTGTLIRNPNLEQSTPVNVTTSDAIELKQSNVAEEVLRELPGVVPSIGSAVNNGNGGASFVDLRGLGSTRNIVLLDGNRLVPSGLAGRVDLNNIPLALIERVDALTGAAVTTYGADAITGVVNFITRKDFAGVEVSASEQITEKGDGNYIRADLTLGANFDDGRGNAVVSLGYQQSDAVYQGARDFSRVQISSYTGGAAGSGTAVPSRFSGLRDIDAACNVIGAGVTGSSGNRGTSQINWGDDPNTTCIGGADSALYSSFNFNPYNVFQTPFTRYNIFAQANYEVSDAVEVYSRGLFSKNNVKTIIAPSGSFGGSVDINLNNPFLPATLRNQFCAFDVNPSATAYTPRFTQAECDAAALATGPDDPAYRVVGAGSVFVPFDIDGQDGIEPGEGYNSNPDIAFNRRSTEVGPRISDFNTTVFDARLGLRGPLTSTIDWDVSGSYGESENIQEIQNYTLQSRFREGALVSLDGLGNPVCDSGNPDCVPVDIFGPEGSITPAMVDFLNEASTTRNKASLGQLRALLSGDFGYALPWATQPIGFAVGTEFRKYKASQASDLLAKQAGELGGAGGAAPDIDGGYSVYEGYGELIAPLIEDKPFAESLTLEAGIRYSKYEVDGVDGGNETWTWKAGGSWEPGYGLKIRGNYSKAVRAPNIGELFTPQTVGLTNLSADPCVGTLDPGAVVPGVLPLNPNLANPDLVAICTAQGAGAFIGGITQPTAGQVNAVFGGNLNLQPETAKTWTLGVVFVPEFLPRFSMSLDYYNIRIKDVIGSALPGDAINACFGDPANPPAGAASDPDCLVIRRNPATGGLDGDPATTPGLFLPLTNLGELFTDGFDLLMNYKTDVGFGDFAWSFVGNWTRNSEYNANAASPDSFFRECAGYYSINCSFTGSIQPKLQFSQRFTLSVDKVDFSLLWRWIDKVKYEPRAIQDDLEAFGVTVLEEFQTIPAEHYFDLTTRFNATDNMTFTFTVQNLLDNQPKLVGNTIGSTTFNSGNVFPSTYDALGRRYAVSAKLKF